MVVNCEQVWHEISNYVDGEVESTLRTAMDDHFHICPRCTSVLTGTQNVIQLYGDERLLEVPSGFGRRLERRLAQSSGGKGWSTLSAWLIPVAALLLVAGGLQLANSLTRTRPLQSLHAQPGRNIPPDMVVVVSADAKVFHVPGCGVIHNRDKTRTMTAKQAIDQGYVPCLRCMRKYLEVTQLRGIGHSNAADEIAEELQAEQKRGLPGAGD